MKITKQYLRNLILETLQEGEHDKHLYRSQIDIENPELEQMKTQAYFLDDKLSRLLLKIKDLDPSFELHSQREEN